MILWSRILLLYAIFCVSSTLWAGAAGSDSSWEARSGGRGVLMATRFDTREEVTDWVHPNRTQNHVSWSTENRASGRGALRFEILKTDGPDSGNWRRWLSDDHREFNEGDEFYVQFRQYIPAYLATHRFKGGGGWKQIIISRHASGMGPGPSGSNQLNEIVLHNGGHRGLVQGYNRNLNKKYPSWQVPKSTACRKNDFILQNAIKRDVSGWGCVADRRRYGGLFSYYMDKPKGYIPGHPDPMTGGFIYYPDEWLTFLIHVKIGTYGKSNHEIQVWAAREADTVYTLLHDHKDRQLGRGPPHDTLWLLPYNTRRQPNPDREDTYTLYDEVIMSTE